jgi:hypothetical protein
MKKLSLPVFLFSTLALGQAVPYPPASSGVAGNIDAGSVVANGALVAAQNLNVDGGILVGPASASGLAIATGSPTSSQSGMWLSGTNLVLGSPSGNDNYVIVQSDGVSAIQCQYGNNCLISLPLVLASSITLPGSTTITAQVLGNCTMAAGTTCSVADTGVSATSTVSCTASGATVGTLASVTGVIVTAGTSYQVNANTANSDTWRCVRWN